MITESPPVAEKNSSIVVSPEISRWQTLLSENVETITALPDFFNSRKQLLYIAENYTKKLNITPTFRKNNQKIIVTGHQAIWHHCGISAKNIVASNFAKQVDGCAIHLVLDHDIRDTGMVLPRTGKDHYFYFDKVEIESCIQNVPLEFRKFPDAEQINNFISRICTKKESLCSKIWESFLHHRQNHFVCLETIADFVTILQAALYSALNIDFLYLPVSQMAQSDSFINFASSIINNAIKFAHIYNDAISKQTATRKNFVPAVKHLEIDDKNNTVELPFWIILPTGQRQSLYIDVNDKNEIKIIVSPSILAKLDLTENSDIALQLRNIISEHNLRLRPKAVSLTLFVRLYLADLFIHGTGGAIYETITDHIIENYYKIKKIHFTTATADMTLFSEAGYFSNQYQSTQIKSHARRLKFNPERLIENSLLDKAPVKYIVAEKTSLIKAIRKPDISINEKSRLHRLIEETNRKLLKYTKFSFDDLNKAVQTLKRQEQSLKVINFREFFFGLFPENRLKDFAILKRQKQ